MATNHQRPSEYVTIEEMGFSKPTYKCLKAGGIHTLADLLTQSEETLRNIRNFGIRKLIEVNEKLLECGYHPLSEAGIWEEYPAALADPSTNFDVYCVMVDGELPQEKKVQFLAELTTLIEAYDGTHDMEMVKRVLVPTQCRLIGKRLKTDDSGIHLAQLWNRTSGNR